MLGAVSVSPLYLAVIVSVPTGNFVVVNVATPPLNVAVPRPSAPLNVTVPVGPPASAELTVAVKVTDCLDDDVLGLDVTMIVEAYRFTSPQPRWNSGCDRYRPRKRP